MKKMNIIKTIIILLISGFSIFMLGFFLSSLRGQNTPYLDASTNIIGITATFLMIWRYREQWLLYIILNLLTITMWLLRFANGSSDGSIMILMWTAFLINSVYGFYNWSKNAENLK
jgi:nicotinamide mononucleotide transporter